MHSLIVYGFPTTGKTTAANTLRAAGYTVVDTDDFLESSREAPSSDERLDALNDALSQEADVMFTNLVSDLARQDVKPRWVFLRSRASDVETLMSMRGHSSISLDVIKDWLDGAKHHAEQWMSSNVIVLQSDEFINDYVDMLIADLQPQSSGDE